MAMPQKKSHSMKNGYQTWGGGMKNLSFSYPNTLLFGRQK